MNDYEVSLSEQRIVEHGFKQQGITATLLVVSTGTVDSVDVHGETKPSSLVCNVAKEKILKRLVVGGRRLATSEVTG